jgi:hypothetical protein
MIDTQNHIDATQLARIQNKIARLAEQYESYGRQDGQDVDGILQSLIELRNLSKEQFIDLGFLIYMKALRLKLGVFRLMADTRNLQLVEYTEEALFEIEGLCTEIELELQREPGAVVRRKEPAIPSSPKQQGDFDISRVPNKGLWNTVMGMLDQVGSDMPVEIPEEMLEYTQTVNFEGIQNQILSMVAKNPMTVKGIAGQLNYGDASLALAFLACLFLEQEKKVRLEQFGTDVRCVCIEDLQSAEVRISLFRVIIDIT